MASAEVRALMLRFSNAMDWSESSQAKPSISSQLAPTSAERLALTARQRALADALMPADSAAIGLMVTSLRSLMPSHDNSDPTMIVKQYMAALAPFPHWVIAEVYRQYRDGIVPENERRFMPTSAQLAGRCRDLMAPHVDEREKLGRVLNAEVRHEPDEDERDRVGRGLRELAARIGKDADEEEKAERERVAAAMRERSRKAIDTELERAGISDGRPISLELRQQISAMTARREQQDMEQPKSAEQREHADEQ